MNLKQFLKFVLSELKSSAIRFQANLMFLQILDRFSGIFFDAFDENSGVNKASGDGDPEAFVRSCNEEHGLLIWQNRYVILLCILD